MKDSFNYNLLLLLFVSVQLFPSADQPKQKTQRPGPSADQKREMNDQKDFMHYLGRELGIDTSVLDSKPWGSPDVKKLANRLIAEAESKYGSWQNRYVLFQASKHGMPVPANGNVTVELRDKAYSACVKKGQVADPEAVNKARREFLSAKAQEGRVRARARGYKKVKK